MTANPLPHHILDTLSTAVISVDADMKILYLNPAAQSVFGVSFRQCNGQVLDQMIPILRNQIPRMQQAVHSGQSYSERELHLEETEKKQLTVDYSATVGQSEDGFPLLMLEFMPRDRQLRISRDEQMLTQNRINRELARGLAHEIKNPLGGIRGAAQLLDKELPSDDLKDFTRVIIRETDRLQVLVDRMLGPNQLPQKNWVNILEVTEHVLRLGNMQTGDQQVRFIRNYDPSIPDILADKNQLIQAVLNLVGNAIEALKDTENAQIEFRTRVRRQFTIGNKRHKLVLELRIQDNGPGIPEKMHDSVFYPMVTGRPDGTGLGLPIAQYLIHNQGGLIEFTSRPGKTKFSILIPLEV